MATLLDDDSVATALQSLDGWSGNATRISRTVQEDDVEGLLAHVAAAADAMDHHPKVERDGDQVTFVVWTHSLGGVTELDLTLAARIDELVTANRR